MNASYSKQSEPGWLQLPHPLRYFLVGILALAAGVYLVYVMPGFLEFIQQRPGIRLNDPILLRLRPKEYSGLIFSVLYGSLLICIATLVPRPLSLLRFMLSALLMYSLRMASLYLVPLAAPAGLIPLKDSWVEAFAYGHHPITKDLFFSGHTAILLLAWLHCRVPVVKWLLLAALLAIVYLLLAQHVHYSLDILGALLAGPACYRLSAVCMRYLGWNLAS